jgi:hypothetical protein
MCWEWEEYLYTKLREQKKQQKKQEAVEEKEEKEEVEETSETKETRARSDAPIYKYLKSEADKGSESKRKVVKAR